MHGKWLLDEGTLSMMLDASRGASPTAEQQTQLEARADAGGGLLNVAGSSAEIPIVGVLTPRPSFMAMIFGGGNTTYEGIISALAEAEANVDVEDITLAIDSPGGSVAGLFETINAINAMTKPVKAVVGGQAASAAYALASQAETITATTRASMFGSIGVVASKRIDPNVVDVTSTQAPKKRPDPTTKSGKAVVVEELDEVHDIFVDVIATGRNMTDKDVNAEFGQGATMLAEKALSRGMIDAIAGGGKVTGDDDHTEARQMNMQDLKAEHPALCAEAVGVGVEQERDRVTAHLIMGENFKAMDTAVAAVKDGSEMTATATAMYMTAAANVTSGEERTDEGEEAAAIAAGAKAPAAEGAESEAEAVMDIVAANFSQEVV